MQSERQAWNNLFFLSFFKIVNKEITLITSLYLLMIVHALAKESVSFMYMKLEQSGSCQEVVSSIIVFFVIK